MALRPFSLLLLLVMIPAVSMLESIEYTPVFRCEWSTWFCLPFQQKHQHNSVIEINRNTKEAEIDWGGFALDTTNPHEWVFTFCYYWDYLMKEGECHFIFLLPSSVRLNCLDVMKSRTLPTVPGLQFIPSRRYDWHKLFELKIKADPGLYVSDVLELYVNTGMGLYIQKKMQPAAWFGYDGYAKATSVAFRPYTCQDGIWEPQDLGANRAQRDDCKFSCGAGTTLFLGGVNTDLTAVYSTAAGWKDLNKKDILKQESDKQMPYCWADTMFEKCLKNRCYVFGDSLVTPKSKDVLEKTDEPANIKTKLGAYVVYSDDDKSWTLQLEYKDLELLSFTIGDEKYEIGKRKFNEKIAGKKVTATITRTGPTLLTGRTSKRFKLEANTDQGTKELTELFGFYGNAQNELKLTFAQKTFVAAGVANHKVYKPTGKSTKQNAKIKPEHDIDNLFKCEGDESIYLNDDKIDDRQLRFTAKGWLRADGTVASTIKKGADGKEEIAVVSCFSVCQTTPVAGSAHTKTQKEYTIEITCGERFVKVDNKGNLLSSVTCEKDIWKADGEIFDVSSNGFSVTCVGDNNLVKVCNQREKEQGCAALRKVGKEFSCEPGFALVMETDGKIQPKIYKSITLKQRESRWMEGTTDIGAAGDKQKPVCYSKCMDDYVNRKLVTPRDSVVKADYEYEHTSGIGTLTCTDTNVLLADLEGSEKSYVNGLTCDKDGWKDGTTLKKDFTNVNSLDQLLFKPYCFKACEDSRIVKECDPADLKPELKYDCRKPFFDALGLKCAETHALFVNGKISNRELVCSKKGWTSRGDDDLVIDFRTNLKDKIKASCFSKCGGKFVSVTAADYSGTGISCPGTKMINYQVNTGAAVDTLEDLTCDKDAGWKAGDQLIAPFETLSTPKIAATCKPSCDRSLIKASCDGHRDCKEVKYANDQMTCDSNYVLLAEYVVELNAMECKKKTFESKSPSTAVTISRTNPTSTAQISCISKCDAWFLKMDPNRKDVDEVGKLKISGDSKTYVECENDLYYATITTKKADDSPDVFAANKFTCDPASGWSGEPKRAPAPLSGNIDGKKLIAGCRSKCENRIKKLSDIHCPADRNCKEVQKDKIKCEDSTHILISMNGRNYEGEYGSDELQCKKDGFYHKEKRVLSFDGKALDHQFDAFCVTKCDKEFVSHPAATLLSPRANPGDLLKCANADELLVVEYGGKSKRVFGEAKCETDKGWKDGTEFFVNFPADSFKISALCVKVCNPAMIKDECPQTQHLKCSKMTYAGKSLSCDAHHRLFLNDISSAETPMNEMACSNKGWQAKQVIKKPGEADKVVLGEMIINFSNTKVEIKDQVKALCKHKCHPDFVDLKISACPEGSTCTEAKYTGTKLTCADPSDPTVILVIKHRLSKRESWDFATCDDNGWKDKDGNVLFNLDGFNYPVKAHCEQICVPNVDSEEALANSEPRNYNPETKMLTCADDNLMLKYDGVGVYSDLICSKEGWRLPKKEVVNGQETEKLIPGDVKFPFTPIIDRATEDSQLKERLKKFTCELNDCLRSNRCHLADSELKCRDPDVKMQKYKISCKSPDKLIKYDSTFDRNTSPVYLTDLTCADGQWTSGSGVHAEVQIPQLADRNEPLDNRTVYPVVCTSDACTICTETLKSIDAGTDTNIIRAVFEKGIYMSCSRYVCPGHHFAIQEDVTVRKFKYYANVDSLSIKCSATNDQPTELYLTPDGQSTVTGHVGCVKQIPCFEHTRIDTTCEDSKCDNNFDEMLKEGSKMNGTNPPPDLKCGELGEMFHEMTDIDGKKAWNKVENLKCTERGEWKATVLTGRKGDTITQKILTAHAEPAWRVVCSIFNLNPKPEDKGYNPKTQTCSLCPSPEDLKCKGCDITTKQGDGECTMTAHGKLKINGNEKTKSLTCKNVNGEYKYISAEGRKVDSFSVIPPDDISTGAIVGIAVGVILVLGLIVFAMVYVAIRKRRELDRKERLKSKGLEQKQDTIIDNVTLVEDSKTLVL